MDIAVQASDETIAKLIASELVKQFTPLVIKLVKTQVEENEPSFGITQQELAKKLRMTVGSDDFNRMAYELLPHYQNGAQTRWNSRAADKFLETYTD